MLGSQECVKSTIYFRLDLGDAGRIDSFSAK